MDSPKYRNLLKIVITLNRKTINLGALGGTFHVGSVLDLTRAAGTIEPLKDGLLWSDSQTWLILVKHGIIMANSSS